MLTKNELNDLSDADLRRLTDELLRKIPPPPEPCPRDWQIDIDPEDWRMLCQLVHESMRRRREDEMEL